jgi:hypothetical protein
MSAKQETVCLTAPYCKMNFCCNQSPSKEIKLPLNSFWPGKFVTRIDSKAMQFLLSLAVFLTAFSSFRLRTGHAVGAKILDSSPP